MLLTTNNAALSLLFDLKLLDHSDTEVLFGSEFPGDRTDMQVSQEVTLPFWISNAKFVVRFG